MPGIPSVNVDDRAGARAAAQHLVDLGHRRVGIVNLAIDGPRGFVDDPLAASFGHPQRQRVLGWLDALSAAGITPMTVQIEHDSEDDAEEVARLLLALEDPPTAVLCFSEVLALGVMRAAEDRGVSVPGDLSVVGFDDSPVARRVRPALTTVRQDIASKGRLAASALAAAIDHARTGTKTRARHHLLPTELIVRQSTAPAPSS